MVEVDTPRACWAVFWPRCVPASSSSRSGSSSGFIIRSGLAEVSGGLGDLKVAEFAHAETLVIPRPRR